MEINSKYSPQEVESKWYKKWESAKIFKSVPDERTPYTIVIPPPNVTGVLHMGHMLNNTIQDVLIRRKRMMGFNACWVPGTDHASIATEAKVVQMLRERGIKKSEIGRDEFLKYAFEWKDKYGGIILQQLRKLGASADWDRTCFTMDDHYYKAVTDTFVDLYEKGYIYRGLRMVNWDSRAMTAISDEEVFYKTSQDNLYHVRYQVENSDEWLVIATTRPETIMADTAIAVHPEDERFQHLKGKNAIVPLVNRVIPIIFDEYVDKEFGTGCLKVTPAHDKNDYEIGLRHDLEVIDILNENGTLNEKATFFVGEEVAKARKLASKELEARGHLLKTEPYTHEVGYSERTQAVIEPRLSQQWFLKMRKLAKPALNAVLKGKVNLIPHNYVNTYRHWMENVKDWCLSRQLWWGQQIPAYFITKSPCESQYVVARTATEALQKAKELTKDPTLTSNDLQQDADVLDTWASSWLWPLEVFKGISNPNNKEFAYYYPTNDLVTAPEILFFWVARMVMAGYEYTGKRPFQNVYLTGIVRDKQRRKMSKSLGNSPDALALIEENGADGVRMGMLLCSPAGNDILYDDALVEQGKMFSNKIWNAFRLVKGWQVTKQARSITEENAAEWFEQRFKKVVGEVSASFEQFRLSEALMTVYKLIWDDFCSTYLEMVKPAYGQPISSYNYEKTIHFFEELMQLLHPFMPFITEEIWQGLRPRNAKEFICTAPYPTKSNYLKTRVLQEMEFIQKITIAVRAFRADKQISPKEPLTLSVQVPQKPEEVVAIPFTNRKGKYTLFDQKSVEYIKSIPEYQGLNILDNVRQHSPSGSSLYQRWIRNEDGKSSLVNLHLHILVAQKFLPKPDETYKYVIHKNGDELDNRIENLAWSKTRLYAKYITAPSNTSLQALIQKHSDLLKKFLNLDAIELVTQKPQGTTSILVDTTEIYLPLTHIDVAAEKAKIQKEIEYLNGFLVSVGKKLENEKFVANAKPEILENERKKKADAESKIASLSNQLKELDA